MLSRLYLRSALSLRQQLKAPLLSRPYATSNEDAASPAKSSPSESAQSLKAETSQTSRASPASTDSIKPSTSSQAEPSSEVTRNASKSTPESNASTTTTSQDTQKNDGTAKPWAQRLEDVTQKFRLPRSVQALYLRPLRRKAEYGLPVCDLQLRSYSVRELEFFADFAMRAAYYLKLPASGPVPLPRIVERWTVPRSNFVHKKSQENFERITVRRLIQIKDGHPESVQLWLAFLRRHAFPGVGMKANVWEFDSLDVTKKMDATAENVNKILEPYFALFGQRKDPKTKKSMDELLNSEKFLRGQGPMSTVRDDVKLIK
ncbi:hypothetical protein VTN31DRAFT_6868 [Thermomyces dupontii]|uniref:mitochondrial 37S ribosomal protein uS10m n=1 Tax=Talaromyces thermophilus TaxID=28565 RepID=UPI003743FA8E